MTPVAPAATYPVAHSFRPYQDKLEPLSCRSVVALIVCAVNVPVKVGFALVAYVVLIFVPATCRIDDALIVGAVQVPVKFGLFVGAAEPV